LKFTELSLEECTSALIHDIDNDDSSEQLDPFTTNVEDISEKDEVGNFEI